MGLGLIEAQSGQRCLLRFGARKRTVGEVTGVQLGESSEGDSERLRFGKSGYVCFCGSLRSLVIFPAERGRKGWLAA